MSIRLLLINSRYGIKKVPVVDIHLLETVDGVRSTFVSDFLGKINENLTAHFALDAKHLGPLNLDNSATLVQSTSLS